MFTAYIQQRPAPIAVRTVPPLIAACAISQLARYLNPLTSTTWRDEIEIGPLTCAFLGATTTLKIVKLFSSRPEILKGAILAGAAGGLLFPFLLALYVSKKLLKADYDHWKKTT